MAIQYLYGDARPVTLPIAAAQVVAVGDIVGQSANTLVRAADWPWGSAVATPIAPVLTNGAIAIGTGLANSLTAAKVSYQFPWGEGPLSPAGTATPTAGAAIVMAPVVFTAPVIGLNIYVETVPGNGIFKLYDQVLQAGGTGQILITGLGTGQVPPATPVTSGALQGTQAGWAAAFVGISAQAKAATGFFGNPQTIPYGNSLPEIRVDTEGVFYGDCALASFTVGQFLGPDKDVGNVMLSQQVVGVAGPQLAIGQVIHAETNVTRVKFRLISSVRGS